MPSRISFIGLLAAIAMAPLAARAGEPPLTLPEAVKLALSRNERARISLLDVDVAQAGVVRARARFLPALNLNANDTLKPTQVGESQGSPNALTASLSLQQPLLDLAAFPLLAQAHYTLTAQEEQTAESLRLLGFDAARAFFGVLTAQEVLRTGERRVESAKAALADASARVQAQLASSNDQTRAELDLATASQQLESDRGTVGNAAVSLGLLIDAQPPEALAPPDATLEAAQAPIGPLEPLIAAALARRLDLASLRHAAAAAHDSAREPLLRIAPTLGFSGSAQASTNAFPGGDHADATLALTLSWALYDSGLRYADLHSREASAQIADLQALAQARTVEAEVRSAAVSLQAAQAASAVANRAVAVAQTNAVQTAALYKQGLAKAIELVDANDQLYFAEVSQVQARYAMALAYLDLRSALGLEPVALEQP